MLLFRNQLMDLCAWPVANRLSHALHTDTVRDGRGGVTDSVSAESASHVTARRRLARRRFVWTAFTKVRSAMV